MRIFIAILNQGSVRRKCCYRLFVYLKEIKSLKPIVDNRWYQTIHYQQDCLTQLKSKQKNILGAGVTSLVCTVLHTVAVLGMIYLYINR